MMRQFTFEIRCDFLDEARFEEFKESMREAARHVTTTAILLKDGPVMPKAILFSDDFIEGHQEFGLFKDEAGELSLAKSPIGSKEAQAAEITDELMEAMRHDDPQ